MIDVSLALLRSQCLPKFFNASLQALKVVGFIHITKKCLHTCPHIFNRVTVWALGWRRPPVHRVLGQFFPCVLAAMLRSLSCWNLCLSGKTFLMNGSKPVSRMRTYFVETIIPVNNTKGVAPRGEMPPHTCTLAGCFALGLSFRGCPILR